MQNNDDELPKQDVPSLDSQIGGPLNPRLIETKEARKLAARRQRHQGIWFGLGMFGMVGWSIALPTVISIFIGVWIDRRWRPPFSCTLTSVFVGVVTGCLIAWYWINRELRSNGET